MVSNPHAVNGHPTVLANPARSAIPAKRLNDIAVVAGTRGGAEFATDAEKRR
jgi:hypothetical protein